MFWIFLFKNKLARFTQLWNYMIIFTIKLFVQDYVTFLNSTSNYRIYLHVQISHRRKVTNPIYTAYTQRCIYYNADANWKNIKPEEIF